MKIIIIILITLLVYFNGYSQEFSNPEQIFSNHILKVKSSEKSFYITHSVSQIIDPSSSVSCNTGGIHYDNHYYRVFDLQNEFNINGDWLVQNVEIGIGLAVSGTGNFQPVELIFYVMSEYNNEIIIDSLTQKGDPVVFDVFDNESGAIKNIEVTPNVNVTLGQVLVVEINVPDGHHDNHSFFIGSNSFGETDSTYIMAGECGEDTPVPMSDLLFPDMHLVMKVLGVYEDPTPEILSFNITDQLTDTEIINDPDWEINIVMPVEAELYELTPVITIPAGFLVIPASGETVDFSGGSITYEVNNEYNKVSQTWDVSVTNAGPDILDVVISGQNGETIIDYDNYKVTVPVPIGTDLTSLSPDIIIHDDQGFIIDPESGTVQDFSNDPVIYTVSHESLPLDPQDWEISVIESEGNNISEFVYKKINIFPNPANNIVKFDVNNIERIEIFDITGNLMYFNCYSEYIDVTDLSEGVYYLKIYSEKYIYNEKLIVIH